VSAATRVLIVDDDVPTRIGLQAILRAEGDMEVVGEAAGGLEAIALSEIRRPDVVLMDVHLPDLDGIEATTRLVSGEGPTPRVIILTTFEVSEYVYRSIRAGASGFLLKRTRAEELVAAIRAVASGEELPVPALTSSLIGHFAAAAEPPPDGTTLPEELTERELAVLELVARGLSNREIAAALSVSHETVKSHVKRTYAKIGARDRAQAVIRAYEAGLVVASRRDGSPLAP
jgi:DNA-binding NarL/FixJ family response regulator